MFASRTLRRRSCAVCCIILAAALGACDELLVAPDGDPTLSLALALSASASAGGSAEAFDAVDRIRIRIRAGQEVVEEIEQAFNSDGGDVAIPIRAPSSVDGVAVTVEVELSSGGAMLFTGRGALTPDAAGDNSAEIVLEPVPAAVLISPSTALFEAFGESITFRAAAVFATGDTIDDATITFRAVTEGIVEVQANGVATSTAEGTTSVEASFAGQTAEAEAEVRQRVTEIEVTRVPTSLAAGASFVIDAMLRDANGYPVLGRTVQWTSSDPTILTIDQNNVARAVGTGTVTVTGTIDDASTSFQVVVAAIPVTPSGLVASAQGTVVSLAWQDNANNETAYEVLRRPVGGSTYATVATLPADAQSYAGDTFAPDARFEYVVRACAGDSCSDLSNIAMVVTVPSTPGSTSIDLDSFTQILTIAWTDTNTETFYIIEVDIDGNWQEYDRTNAGVTDLGINVTVDPNATYAYWRIYACNAAGCSPPTPSFSLYSGGSKPSRPAGGTIRR